MLNDVEVWRMWRVDEVFNIRMLFITFFNYSCHVFWGIIILEYGISPRKHYLTHGMNLVAQNFWIILAIDSPMLRIHCTGGLPTNSFPDQQNLQLNLEIVYKVICQENCIFPLFEGLILKSLAPLHVFRNVSVCEQRLFYTSYSIKS